jgi:hypothetical protein
VEWWEKQGHSGLACCYALVRACCLLWGFLTDEWKLANSRDRRWMFVGLTVLLIAIATLGWSSTLV